MASPLLCLVFIIVLHGSVSASGCPYGWHDFYDNNCAQIISLLNWTSAMERCSELQSEIVTVDMLIHDNKTVVANYLQKQNVTSLWMEVKQPVQGRGRRYRAPRKYDQVFPVQKDPMSGALKSGNITWSTEHLVGSCVLLTYNGAVQLQMEDCSQPHPIVCAYKWDRTPRERCAGSELKIRHEEEGNEYFLDMLNRCSDISPACYLEGASFINNRWAELLEKRNRSSYMLITEEDGWVKCEAVDAMETSPVYMDHSTAEERTFLLSIKYNTSECRDYLCDPSIDDAFLNATDTEVRDLLDVSTINIVIQDNDTLTIVYRWKTLRSENWTAERILDIFHKKFSPDRVSVRDNKFCVHSGSEVAAVWGTENSTGARCFRNLTGAYWNGIPDTDRVSPDNPSNLTAEYILNISQILSNTDPETLQESDVGDLVNEINNLLLQSDNVYAAQMMANSSNIILENLDKILSGIPIENKTVVEAGSLFVSFVSDVDVSSTLRSVAVRNTANMEHKVITNEALNTADVASVQLPESLFVGSHRVVVNLFLSNVLFRGGHPPYPRHILSVTVDNERKDNLSNPVVLWFRKEHTDTGLKEVCVFWDFHGNNSHGNWSSRGCSVGNITRPGYTMCQCDHLTHFGVLLFSDVKEQEPLTYITIIGCSLSILGLSGIFVTAIALPQWRRGTGKRMQLHLSGALLLLMVSFLLGEFKLGEDFCIATGVLKHFSLLVVYSWMFFVAWYQYRRVTEPLKALDHIPHYLLGSAILSWGMPLLLCTLLLIVITGIYDPPKCYPTGEYLTFSVILPVGIVLIVNTCFFIRMLYSIFECKKCMMTVRGECIARHQDNTRRMILNVVSSANLFILLGLCWVFGFLGWQYLFCITATLQGFTLFVFFVLLDRSTRAKWERLLERCGWLNPRIRNGGLSQVTFRYSN